MFDIGFSELLVIGIVALIVIGPQRLPQVARTLGHLFGRMQRYVNDVKADIAREMELAELKKLQTTIEDAAGAFQGSVNQEVNAAESELNKLAQSAQPDDPFREPAAAAPAAAAGPPSAQREAPLDTSQQAPAQKQA
jgi:sec-independent protein translocase protein TatB